MMKTNGFWHTLNDHQKACAQAGLPLKYLETDLNELKFERYAVVGPSGRPMAASAHNQRAQISRFIEHEIMFGGDYKASILLHSHVSGEAAMSLGVLMAETAVRRKMIVASLTTNHLDEAKWKNERSRNVYLIHIVVPGLPAADYIKVRNFLQDHANGSLVIVVAATPGNEGDLSHLVKEELRFNFDYQICLEDADSYIRNEPERKDDSSATNEVPAALPVARRLNHKTTSA